MQRSHAVDAASSPIEGGVIIAIRSVVRRTRIRHALVAATMVVASAAAGLLVGHPIAALTSGLTAAGVTLWHRRGDRSTAAAARSIEQAIPGSRNLVITAEELLRHPERAAPWMRARVLADAAACASAIPSHRIAPLTWPAVVCALSGCVTAVLFTAAGRETSDVIRTRIVRLQGGEKVEASAPLRVVVTVTPPAYTRKPTQQQQDPPRIEALEGSNIRLAVSGAGPGWRVRSAAGVLATSHEGAESIVETLVVQSGYFAIEPMEPRGDGAAAGERRLIPLTMIPDRAPTVRVEAPGRDLVLPDAKGTVAIMASASDDIGLRSLELRYTKVSGSGEQFEFQEGTLPVTLTTATGQAWTASTLISTAALKLLPGDALVYRAVARDQRPGDEGLATSDTFFVEIAAPGQAALQAFEMPPNQQRYALSQQMIVLEIERLRSRERRMSREALTDAAASIAARQRAVRANFVFLMGEEVEDARVQAARSTEIQAERGQDTANHEMNAAVVHMSRAEVALGGVDTSTALTEAKAAVEALQRAFGRGRYILRTIPVASRVDPSRRLTGELSGAGDWRREIEVLPPDRELIAARTLLSRLLDTASQVSAGRTVDPSAFAALAEQALAIQPGDTVWQQVAGQLQAIARAHGGTPESISSQISDAAAPVIARARQAARMAPQRGTRSPAALERSWVKEFKR